MKLCQACNTEKPETEFYRDKTRSDGLNWRCKPCHKEHVAHLSMQPPRNPAPEGMKRCQRCKETKSVDEFYADKNQYDGRQRMCKPCQTARHKQWASENKAKVTELKKRQYRKDPARFMDYERKKRYGMAPGEYLRMLTEQDGRCAICGTDSPAPRRSFAVDHCHDTGTIRALLCSPCNSGIGQLKHSIDILKRAIKYLEDHTSSKGSGV